MNTRFRPSKITIIIIILLEIAALGALLIIPVHKKLVQNEEFVYDSVVIIGVDGAGNNFQNIDMPNLQKIISQGAVNYNVLTSEPTISAQCWGSLLTGATPEKHGLTNSIVESTPYDVNSDYPTVFRIIRENDNSCELASFCQWEPINIGIVEEGMNVYKEGGTDEEITQKVCKYLSEHNPKLLFVHFGEVDEVGHAYGFKSEEYYNCLSTTDDYIGKIFNTLSKNGGDKTLFIVTADHGGVGTSHGGDSNEEKYVMYAAAGATVSKGGSIGSMNIRDNAAVVLKALGYDIPESMDANVPWGILA